MRFHIIVSGAEPQGHCPPGGAIHMAFDVKSTRTEFRNKRSTFLYIDCLIKSSHSLAKVVLDPILDDRKLRLTSRLPCSKPRGRVVEALRSELRSPYFKCLPCCLMMILTKWVTRKAWKSWWDGEGTQSKAFRRCEGAGAGACSWMGGSWCDGIGGWEFSFKRMLLAIP